jgi:hypothetical protein
LVGEVAAKSLTRDAARAARKASQGSEGSQRKFQVPQFAYSHPEGNFKVEVKFRDTNVADDDIKAALREALSHIEGRGESDNDPEEGG